LLLKNTNCRKFLKNHLKKNGECSTDDYAILDPQSLEESGILQATSLPKPADAHHGTASVGISPGAAALRRRFRPEARNAIGKEMLRGLRHTFETLETDDEANVVMISSSVPKAFCAGADLKERKEMTASEVQFFVHTLRSTFELIERYHRAGGTQRLPRIVGKAVAKELIFTGRRIGGQEAMSIGLANYTVPAWTARSKALEIAREINQKGPIAIRLAKKAINEGIEMDMERALEFEKDCYKQLVDTNDRLEGLAAFAEKRKPRYTGS
ncbi:Probable enoyl-CoA hydratase 2, mitochondrial, partial [Linum perenne]